MAKKRYSRGSSATQKTYKSTKTQISSKQRGCKEHKEHRPAQEKYPSLRAMDYGKRKEQAPKNSVRPIVIEKRRLIKRIEKVFWSRKQNSIVAKVLTPMGTICEVGIAELQQQSGEIFVDYMQRLIMEEVKRRNEKSEVVKDPNSAISISNPESGPSAGERVSFADSESSNSDQTARTSPNKEC